MLTTPMGVGDEGRSDGIQFRQLTYRGAGDHPGLAEAHEPNHCAPIRREPELYSWIENLVRGRIPPIGQNQRSGFCPVALSRQL